MSGCLLISYLHSAESRDVDIVHNCDTPRSLASLSVLAFESWARTALTYGCVERIAPSAIAYASLCFNPRPIPSAQPTNSAHCRVTASSQLREAKGRESPTARGATRLPTVLAPHPAAGHYFFHQKGVIKHTPSTPRWDGGLQGVSPVHGIAWSCIECVQLFYAFRRKHCDLRVRYAGRLWSGAGQGGARSGRRAGLFGHQGCLTGTYGHSAP